MRKDITDTAAYVRSYCHNIISSGSPPVFHECTSVIDYHTMVIIHTLTATTADSETGAGMYSGDTIFRDLITHLLTCHGVIIRSL